MSKVHQRPDDDMHRPPEIPGFPGDLLGPEPMPQAVDELLAAPSSEPTISQGAYGMYYKCRNCGTLRVVKIEMGKAALCVVNGELECDYCGCTSFTKEGRVIPVCHIGPK